MKRWFAVYTIARNEERASYHLRNQGYEVYLPLFRKKRRHARRTDWVKMPLFPRYLFVQLDLEVMPWRAVHSTLGVSALVCSGDGPVPIRNELIAAIQGRESPDGLVRINEHFCAKPGKRVTLLDGPFAEFEGIFESMRDDQRMVILLEFLGRPLKVVAPKNIVNVTR